MSFFALGSALVALALVDSLSVGTLAVPVWLMLAPGRPRARRILLYLLVLAVFYFLVGLVLLSGANVLVMSSDIDWGSPAAMRVLFFFGAVLLAASFVAARGWRVGALLLRTPTTQTKDWVATPMSARPPKPADKLRRAHSWAWP